MPPPPCCRSVDFSGYSGFSTRKLISSSFHRLDMTLVVAEALNTNKRNLDMTLPVAEALNPNKPN